MAGQFERRISIYQRILVRKTETIDNLAMEFNVSRPTIQRDIADLMMFFPIETRQGLAGGVFLAERQHGGVITDEESEALRKAIEQLDGQEKKTLEEMLIRLSMMK